MKFLQKPGITYLKKRKKKQIFSAHLFSSFASPLYLPFAFFLFSRFCDWKIAVINPMRNAETKFKIGGWKSRGWARKFVRGDTGERGKGGRGGEEGKRALKRKKNKKENLSSEVSARSSLKQITEFNSQLKRRCNEL